MFMLCGLTDNTVCTTQHLQSGILALQLTQVTTYIRHSAVNEILAEYNLPQQDTPVTTDHGSNAAAALRNTVWLDYHRFNLIRTNAA